MEPQLQRVTLKMKRTLEVLRSHSSGASGLPTVAPCHPWKWVNNRNFLICYTFYFTVHFCWWNLKTPQASSVFLAGMPSLQCYKKQNTNMLQSKFPSRIIPLLHNCIQPHTLGPSVHMTHRCPLENKYFPSLPNSQRVDSKSLPWPTYLRFWLYIKFALTSLYVRQSIATNTILTWSQGCGDVASSMSQPPSLAMSWMPPPVLSPGGWVPHHFTMGISGPLQRKWLIDHFPHLRSRLHYLEAKTGVLFIIVAISNAPSITGLYSTSIPRTSFSGEFHFVLASFVTASSKSCRGGQRPCTHTWHKTPHHFTTAGISQLGHEGSQMLHVCRWLRDQRRSSGRELFEISDLEIQSSGYGLGIIYIWNVTRAHAWPLLIQNYF